MTIAHSCYLAIRTSMTHWRWWISRVNGSRRDVVWTVPASLRFRKIALTIRNDLEVVGPKTEVGMVVGEQIIQLDRVAVPLEDLAEDKAWRPLATVARAVLHFICSYWNEVRAPSTDRERLDMANW